MEGSRGRSGESVHARYTHVGVCAHTRSPAQSHTCPHTDTCANARLHTDTHAHSLTHTQLVRSSCILQTCTITDTHTLSHAYTLTCTHTRAHTHTSLTTCPGMPAHRKQAPPLAGQMRSKGKLGGFRAPQLAHGAHLPRAHVFTPVGARGVVRASHASVIGPRPVHSVSAETPRGFRGGADLAFLSAARMRTVSTVFTDAHIPVDT